MLVETDTIRLLQVCDSGCQMAVNSMKQVKEYAEKENLVKLLDETIEKHKKLQRKFSVLLKQSGREEKEPDKMASAYSWITTEMKLMIKGDSAQIAKIMMNGCNTGIQSVSESIHACSGASRESMALAKDLVKTEEEFMKELKAFL